MEAKAVAKYIRISPRKVKIVADLVRGKSVDEALAILKFTPKKGAEVLEKVVQSALANAENNFSMDRDNLYVAQVYANQGPVLKRWRPRAQGRAFQIKKRTSHVGVVLQERE
ncbi:50S ribosomal protein L22 [Clostridiisalibacter paucivorans]|uniref:50S ribosomal protein L22 n=1 Tax=Clostridiisalibacter paucivorans TaxID=408753 RepID=UPI0004796006|nr:50S ribosomal protein L22 [Clostridiisalibacter paucivorans]